MNKPKIIRKAARTVIIDEELNKIAIIEAMNGDYHKIPGGGLERNERPEDAALREALEEGSCDVELITRLPGEIEFENPKGSGKYNNSVCFLARKIKCNNTLTFTQEEIDNKFKLLWLTFDEAIKRLENVKSEVRFDLLMNNRDLAFVRAAKKYLDENNN